ncbi:TOX high mobility group box protein, putative (DUF1635) [Melia azedarach]|uniref:TOX high mobility group box protein, putative (DUF1635) n=1 Tax=Melia azedarach TaxID=155640 RepID=A0ACC1YRV8_MELAZ|nr:TOX high mobility group box protein, putative (DUF1635) [Melia azedarach]
MEELGSLWSYQESVDELKQKLLCVSFELESVKMEANESLRKHKEEMKHLLNLLKVACQERDEAKEQLQKLLNKFMPSSATELHPSIRRHVQHESPLVVPTKANSSITESNSLSETYNPQSHISSPVDSFFDAVSSPDFSNINMADSSNIGFVNQPMVQDYSVSMSTGLVSSAIPGIDAGTAVIDSIAKGKHLPQQGKLLQAVMEAGPLLQTLLVAGPLPRWRNPPPLQPFKIPPFSIKGCETMNIDQKPPSNSSCVGQKSFNSPSYLQMSRMSSQMCSTSVLNFSSCPSGSGQSNGLLFNSATGFNTQIPAGKRQRFQ